eukprot:2040783-Rhodomonas_salina.1
MPYRQMICRVRTWGIPLRSPNRCPVLTWNIPLRSSYEMPGTDIGYAATRRSEERFHDAGLPPLMLTALPLMEAIDGVYEGDGSHICGGECWH